MRRGEDTAARERPAAARRVTARIRRPVRGHGACPEEDASCGGPGREVERLLARLPEKQRAAFVMARLDGLAYEDVAEVLDTTVPAVKSLVHRATVTAALPSRRTPE